MITAQQVLEYWIGPEVARDQVPVHSTRWFGGGPSIDEEIRERFADVLEPARKGELDAWAATPEGALALVIVLDQFPRNVHRATPQAFAYDSRALEVARAALERGDDRAVHPVASVFFYLPFEHSENLEDQQRSVDKTKAALAEASGPAKTMIESFVDYAERHQVVIERFGRFPHRNAILGRDNTDEETEFLKQPGSSF